MFRRFVVAGSLIVVATTVVGVSPASAATDWKKVSAGGNHTCAIRSVGKLYCWGSDSNGQVGNGATTDDVISPAQITAAADWKTVSSGFAHTCAIRSVGKLYCWGNDGAEQIGNGATTGNVISPKQITAATDWKAVDAGSDHTCAIRSVGKLYCWGADGNGQVGNGGATASNVLVPKQITAATDWKAVSAGESHTCAVRGKLYCWGDDSTAQVGNGATTGDVTAPKQITAATDWKAVSAGGHHTCAVRGKLYCWGSDSNGQVGNGDATSDDVTSPKQITADTTWKAVSAGADHTCGIKPQLLCWGSDSSGKLGNGLTAAGLYVDVTVPTWQGWTGAIDWIGVSAGNHHACAVRGKLYCWGSDAEGQLGNGTPPYDAPSPGPVNAPDA